MRAFIAIELPEAVAADLAAVQDRLKGAGVIASWPRPASIHLTVKFLGDVDESLLPRILAALEAAAAGSDRLGLQVAGVGTFPAPAAARVVWLGLAGDLGKLAALHAAVEQGVAALGFPREARPYTPHLTLGRVKGVRKRDLWLATLAQLRDVRLPQFDVTEVGLFGSELTPAGAVHRKLGGAALRAGAGGDESGHAVLHSPAMAAQPPPARR